MGLLRAAGRRPTLAIELGVAAAWAALVAVHLLTGAHAHHHAGHVHSAFHGHSAILPSWGLMAMAMMLPTAMPAVRHVTVNSLYWRRQQAMLEFVLAYLAVWIAFGVVLVTLPSTLSPQGSALAFAGLLAFAAAWQLTPFKQRALRACHRPVPLPPSGRRASAGTLRFGLRNGAACLASCWALMLTMAAAGAGGLGLVWMGVLTVLVAAEKLSLKPRWAARRNAALLGALALGALVVALFAQSPELPSVTS